MSGKAAHQAAISAPWARFVSNGGVPPPPDEPRRSAPVPQGRTRRLLHLGRAVGELAAGAAAEGVARLARGESLALSQLMLTPGNARRLAARLSALRGAAMKAGQLMSMDGKGVLPPHFAELLGGLRDSAHRMPATQLVEVLEHEYGRGWDKRFLRLSFEPIAAASIGQVHRAVTHEGRALALKIQYPGVRQSIDSDVANLGLLARTPGLVPPAIDVAPLLARVRTQLHRETDYATEAQAQRAYRERLGEDPVFWVPAVVPEHCTARILATEWAPGLPVDRLGDAPRPGQPGLAQAQRDHIAHALAQLTVREFFEMGLVQTDPNFANYLYDASTGRIALLDFGATEAVDPLRREQLREIGRGLRDGDRARVTAAALAVGFIAAQDPPAQAQAIIDLMHLAGEPLRHRGPYDFGASDLFNRSYASGRDQYLGEGFARTPPPDLLFLQRKFAGSFMLCARLQARVDVQALFAPHL